MSWEKVIDINQGRLELLYHKVTEAISDHRKLFTAFCWIDSPQGSLYWCDICSEGHTEESLKYLNELLSFIYKSDKPIEEWL